jgi:hypothetical protein
VGRDNSHFHEGQIFNQQEIDMDWLSQNWIWVIFGVAFVAMHMFGHGGHGGHGHGHGGHADPSARPEGSRPIETADTGSRHHH